MKEVTIVNGNTVHKKLVHDNVLDVAKILAERPDLAEAVELKIKEMTIARDKKLRTRT